MNYRYNLRSTSWLSMLKHARTLKVENKVLLKISAHNGLDLAVLEVFPIGVREGSIGVGCETCERIGREQHKGPTCEVQRCIGSSHIAEGY
jgi:hypothetical protein